MKPKFKPRALKRLLFEPVAPYYADAYNTLSSIVQGLALGVYGYEVAKLFFEVPSPFADPKLSMTAVVCKLMIAFLSICVLWHRYITHDQFYAWRLGVLDTIIPIVFGLLEILLILTIAKAFVYFASIFACLSTWGIVAYINTIHRHNDPPADPNARILYREHFASLGEGFADAFFYEIARFERRAQRQLIITAVALWSVVLFMKFSSIPGAILDSVFIAMALIVLVYMLIFDLWRQLEHSPRLEIFQTKPED